jgi:hypothetical protein
VLRLEREVRTTDRVFVVRTKSPPAGPPRPAEPAPRAAAPEPGPRPAATSARAPADEPTKPAEPRRDDRGQPVVLPSSTGSLQAAAAAPVPADAPRTRIAVAAAARTAASATRRRDSRSAEPAVHVEIGRLEVNAARPERRTGSARPLRREPAVNLADYLSERATP